MINFLHLRKPTAGFTLMETLVAMMLLSISLVVILQLFSGGLKSGKMAEDYTRAVFHAREKMEEYLLIDDFEEGTFEGSFGDNYRWQVDIKFVEPEDSDEDEEEILMVDFYHVDVSVFWPVGGSEKSFRISTLKITEKKPDDAG
jgi:general secretion pathway protein I